MHFLYNCLRGNEVFRTRMVIAALFIWMCCCQFSKAAAEAVTDQAGDSRNIAVETSLSAQLQTRPLIAFISYLSNRDQIKLVLLERSRHFWRRLANVRDDDMDFSGDYSPTPNTDTRGFMAPPPLLGHRRRLLQDYTPVANTNNPPPIAP
ncbi:hypothetical protein KP509_19G041300 [Ceratopteris richardii]|uniref:Uncharacterized protein n=1 Tax=Ceratopteris richardii TaxID=49495 RepID=A0A8T2SLT7_CERRI|nr:hypothetical protein KP509_19G041300 [Ceratopteris richardii]